MLLIYHPKFLSHNMWSFPAGNALKRGREDGDATKDTVNNDNGLASYSAGTFERAAPDVLAARRKVTAQRNSKKEQFIQHISVLNKSFQIWVKDQVEKDPSADLSEGFQDYADFAATLEDRYLRTFGEVLTFGSGDCGQLAHGIENDEDLMVKYPRIVYSLRDKKVCGIACGGIHNAVYTETGQVYTWGCADDGSLGRPGDESMPLLVENLVSEVIIRVACGDGQTIAVSAAGEVWGWGCYKDKEGKKWFNPAPDAVAPTKDIKKQQNSAIRITGLQSIVEIACGASFNLAKSDDGTIYSWGLGESGELGRYAPPMRRGDDYELQSILTHHLTPGFMYFYNGTARHNNSKDYTAQLMKVTNVKAFGCGAYHSMLTIVGDEAFACGLNNYGQLGVGDGMTETKWYLVKIPGLEKKGIVEFSGGMHHSLALSSDGTLYAFGRSDSGQLGTSEASTNTGEFCDKPVKPTLPAGTKVIGMNCGGNHNLALTSKNEVYSWGYGDLLALGHGDEKDETLPRKLNFSKAKIANITVTQVAGGGQHSAIIGKVIST